MFRRNASAHGEVDLLKEVQGSEGQTTVQDAAEEYGIIYSKGDVVALKHNYKRYIIPFFLAVLLKDLHHNGDAFLRQVVTKGSKLRCAPFQSQLDSKLEGIGLEDL